MKVLGNVPDELKRLVNFIVKRDGDCECLCGKKSWYGHDLWCGPLHDLCYRDIGYSIHYRGYNVSVDCELQEIDIY